MARNCGDQPEAGTGWELGKINPMSIFSFGWQSACFAWNGGEVLEASFNSRLFWPSSFPSDSVCKNLWESTSSSYVSSSPPLKSTRVSSLLQLSLLPLMMQNVSQGFDLQLKCLSIKYASSGKDESFAPDRRCQKRVTEFRLCYIKLVYWTVSINSCPLSTISPSTTLDAGNFMVYMKKFIILATC